MQQQLATGSAFWGKKRLLNEMQGVPKFITQNVSVHKQHVSEPGWN